MHPRCPICPTRASAGHCDICAAWSQPPVGIGCICAVWISKPLLAYGGIDAAWPVAACALSDSELVNGCICVVWFYTLLVSGGIRAVVNRASLRGIYEYTALIHRFTRLFFMEWLISVSVGDGFLQPWIHHNIYVRSYDWWVYDRRRSACRD